MMNKLSRTFSRNLIFCILITFSLFYSGCTTLSSTPSQKENIGTEEQRISVLAWMSVPAEFTSRERYEELREGGFTHSYTHFPDLNSIKEALKIAHKEGIKLIVGSDELWSNPERIIEEIKNEPALAGYFLKDEPTAHEFDMLTEWVKRIQAVDNEHFCYINLFPNYGSMPGMGVQNYREYVQKFIEKVPVKLLSYDHYPIRGTGEVNLGWYDNLKIFADEAKKAGKPYWAFAVSIPQNPFEYPTIPNIRLQAFTNLAYGAQGFQYWVYWTSEAAETNGPITTDGKRTEIYDILKKVNHEIRGWSEVFYGSEVSDVFYLGAAAPEGITNLKKRDLPKPFKKLEVARAPVIVSILKNKDYKYMVIVSQDGRRVIKMNIQHEAEVKRILKDGSAQSIDKKESYEVLIEAGDAVIYRWKE